MTRREKDARWMALCLAAHWNTHRLRLTMGPSALIAWKVGRLCEQLDAVNAAAVDASRVVSGFRIAFGEGGSP